MTKQKTHNKSELIRKKEEVLTYGLEVFNNEKNKFQHWLESPNFALNGLKPESLLKTLSGIQTVRNCLNKIEFGNFA